MSSEAIDEGIPTEDGDEGWLESDDETGPPLISSKGDYAMATKDTSKVQGKMYDDGYRTGIGVGKEAKIQVGFDQGYNQEGAALGQKYGHLLGSVTAMEQYIYSKGTTISPVSREVAFLKAKVKSLQISNLIEPDWDALEHERQHGTNVPHIQRETGEEKKKRESILDNLQSKADEMMQKVLKE